MTYCGAASAPGTRGRCVPLLVVATGLVLAGCEREEPAKPPPAKAPAVAAAQPPAPWFICDGLNAPTLLVVSRRDAQGQATVLTLDKADLHPPLARLYRIAPPQADANGATLAISREGAAAGHIRLASVERLPRPGEATTAPVVEVKLDDGPALSCRWLLRTRLFGVTAGRSILVTDEEDGPLLRTFDFKAPTGGRVLPDGAQRSSLPTVRIPAGRKSGDTYVFANEGYGYTVSPDGVSITEDGRPTTAEPFIALQRG